MNKRTSASRSAAKPYPRRCAECGKVAVTATTIPYKAEVKHDGKLHKFRIAKLSIDKCGACGEEKVVTIILVGEKRGEKLLVSGEEFSAHESDSVE